MAVDVTQGQPLPTSWEIRDRVLVALGFTSYRAYLASDLWQRLRSEVLAREANCNVCRWRRANQVHHTVYTYRSMTTTAGLIPVCTICHEKASVEHGRVVTAAAATVTMGRFRKAHKVARKQRRKVLRRQFAKAPNRGAVAALHAEFLRKVRESD